MSVNDESAGPGGFVAYEMPTPRWTNKWTLVVWLAMVAFLIVGMMGVSLGWLPFVNPKALVIVFLGAPFVFMAFQMRGWMGLNQKIDVGVTEDGLTVDRWPADIFRFGDVTLGLWTSAVYGGTTSGTALHLRSGRHRLVIGGRDHRVAAGTRLDEPPVQYPNAWMSAADFDELLTAVARRGELGVRTPAPGAPTRCSLIPCPNWFFSDTLSGSLAAFTRPFKLGFSRRAQSAAPTLALDVDDGAVRVIDPATKTVLASARLTQVTATPAIHTYYRKAGLAMPVMVVRIPGLQERLQADRPLTVTCRDGRFTWGTQVPSEPAPAFVVSGADWRTLVEKFGLAPYLSVTSDEVGAAYQWGPGFSRRP